MTMITEGLAIPRTATASAAGLLGLTFDRTVDRSLLHRYALSEVFLTDSRRIDDRDYIAAAQLPPFHAHYTDHPAGGAGIDPMLLLECARQAETYGGHVYFGVPTGTHFILRRWSMRIDAPHALRRPVAPTELRLTVHTHTARVVDDQLRALTYDVGLVLAERQVGTVSIQVAYLDSAAYRQLRGRRRGDSIVPTSADVIAGRVGVPRPERRRVTPAQVGPSRTRLPGRAHRTVRGAAMRTAGMLSIEAAATWLPPRTVPLRQAVAEERLTADDLRTSGYERVPVAEDVPAPQLAVHAAQRALRTADRDADTLGLLIHGWTYHQGHEFWSPAHYVADRLGARAAIPLGIAQMCNGGGAALELAATRLLADPGTSACLVTTADCFGDPGFDRWRGDYGVIYGDGATAAVLTRGDAGPRGLDLLAISSFARADLEVMHRGEQPFSTAPRQYGQVIDVRAAKKAYLATTGKEAFVEALTHGIRTAVGAALADARLAPDDPRLRWVLLPRLGRTAQETIYGPAVAAVTSAPCVDLGEHTGHLGAGDALANLAALTGEHRLAPGEAAEHRLAPGEAAVVLSAGAGFTWTGIVVAAPATTPTRPGRTPDRYPGPDKEEVSQ